MSSKDSANSPRRPHRRKGNDQDKPHKLSFGFQDEEPLEPALIPVPVDEFRRTSQRYYQNRDQRQHADDNHANTVIWAFIGLLAIFLAVLVLGLVVDQLLPNASIGLFTPDSMTAFASPLMDP